MSVTDTVKPEYESRLITFVRQNPEYMTDFLRKSVQDKIDLGEYVLTYHPIEFELYLTALERSKLFGIDDE